MHREEGTRVGRGSLPPRAHPSRRTPAVRLGELPLASPRGTSTDVGARFEALSEEIRACRRCPLGETRTHAVVYRGGLAPWVVFVGEAPGAREDETGVPFVGRSGARLDAAIARLRLTEGEFGVLNLLKCRPPANRFDRKAAATCRPFLERQLELLRPRVLVSLGAHALRELDPTSPPVLEAAGTSRRAGTRSLFPLIHPAAALRSRRLAERWERDVDRLRELLDGLAD
jgi:uracil-DNA glycosylase